MNERSFLEYLKSFIFQRFEAKLPYCRLFRTLEDNFHYKGKKNLILQVSKLVSQENWRLSVTI